MGSSVPPWLVLVGIVLLVLLVVFAVGSIRSCVASSSSEEGTTGTEGDVVSDDYEFEPITVDYDPSILGIDAIADSGEIVVGYTLVTEGDSYTPSLTADEQAAIESALAPFLEEGYDVGFSILNLELGSGYAYNIDQEVYGASSIKGPVLIWGCQEAIEPGILSVSTVESYCENAIIWSDNTSYYRMRNYFRDYAEISFGTWLANMNIDSSLADDTYFPHYSARDSLKLWMNAYLYFTSSDSTDSVVEWAKDLFSQTDTSWIRDVVEAAGEGSSEEGATDDNSSENGAASGDDSSDGGDFSDAAVSDDDSSDGDSSEDESALGEEEALSASASSIVVYDKAGWIDGTEDDAICDAGIVVEGDTAYLITIMTGAPDSETNRTYVTSLAAALWNARASLSSSEYVAAASQS